MDDDFTTDETPPRRYRVGRQTALLLAALAFAAFARGYLAMLPRIRAARQISDDFGLGETAVLSLVAIAASVVAVLVGRKFVNRPTAWLLAMAAGGLATAVYDAFLGALVGVAVGLLMVSRWARRLMLMGLRAVLAVGIGTVAGTLALWLDPDLSDGPSAATLAAVAAAVLCGAALLLWPTRRRRAADWRRALGRAVLLFVGIAGLWPSLTVDMLRRVNHLAGEDLRISSAVYYWAVERRLTIRPWSKEWLWPGPLAVESLTVANNVTDDDLRAVRGWKELQALAIVSDRVTDDGLANLDGLASLFALSISSDHITDAGMDHIIPLTGITWLRLHRAQISGRGLNLLSQSLSLRVLTLDDTAIGDDDLAPLAGFGGLFALSLNRTRVTDRGMNSLSAPTSFLVELNLAQTQITDRGLNALSRLPGLRALDVSGTRITGEGLSEIDPLNRLSQLDLSGTAVTDRGLARLAAFDDLFQLKLNDTAITDAGLQQIAHFPLLWLLDIEGTRTTDSGLATLQYCSQLRQLVVRRTQVTEEGVAEFRRVWPETLLFAPAE